MRDLASVTGGVSAHVDYSSFGQALSTSNPAAADRFLFTGREWDGETSLYFFRARYYVAGLGRFLNEDPAGFGSGDLNLFRYVLNHPTTSGDPTGLTEAADEGLFASFQRLIIDPAKIHPSFG